MPTVLVAYVPSASSEAALEFAIDEARRRSASLLVLASESSSAAKARAVTDTRPLADRLAETGLEFDLRTVEQRSDPADDILDALDSDPVDLAVLGMRRRTPIGKILLGSTTQRVVLESKVPVVLVKPKEFTPPSRF